MRVKKGAFSFFFCGVAAWCGVLFCYAAQEKSEAPASVNFPEPIYTFDAVFEGLSVAHDFVVQNTGTGVLDVEKVQGG